jgi:hypothetical protein
MLRPLSAQCKPQEVFPLKTQQSENSTNERR